MTLNRFLALRRSLVGLKRLGYVRVFGMHIHPTVQLSLRAILDLTHPQGIHIGANTWVAAYAHVFTHDRTRGLYVNTRIGENCFIGAHSIILPGIAVGDGSIVAAGAVVTKDVAPKSIVAGNPAIVVRENIEVGRYGRMASADATTRRLEAEGLVRYKPRPTRRRMR